MNADRERDRERAKKAKARKPNQRNPSDERISDGLCRCCRSRFRPFALSRSRSLSAFIGVHRRFRCSFALCGPLRSLRLGGEVPKRGEWMTLTDLANLIEQGEID